MKMKYLSIFRDKKLVNKVTFQKVNEIEGWRAVDFDRDKYLPFYLYDSPEKMRDKLESEGFNWEWS